MANKKLKIEVDLETTKAKRQLAGMADGGGSSPVDSAAEKTARALEKATKGANNLGDTAEKTSVERSLDTQKKALSREAEELSRLPESRQDNSAVDALSRVGGAFAGAGSGDALLRSNQEQVSLLRSIERKTGGGATWM